MGGAGEASRDSGFERCLAYKLDLVIFLSAFLLVPASAPCVSSVSVSCNLALRRCGAILNAGLVAIKILESIHVE